jgi:hypothetical protein
MIVTSVTFSTKFNTKMQQFMYTSTEHEARTHTPKKKPNNKIKRPPMPTKKS